MANSHWGKSWYEAPTEITRNDKTYYFIGNIKNGYGTFSEVDVQRLKQIAKHHHISIRVLCRASNDYVSELWATNKHLNKFT